jgi:hypothetical protein
MQADANKEVMKRKKRTAKTKWTEKKKTKKINAANLVDQPTLRGLSDEMSHGGHLAGMDYNVRPPCQRDQTKLVVLLFVFDQGSIEGMAVPERQA